VIPFEVPFNGTTRELTSTTSTTTFNEFCLKLAKKMETQLSLLSLILATSLHTS
jgi:hypothetical protein